MNTFDLFTRRFIAWPIVILGMFLTGLAELLINLGSRILSIESDL